MECPGSLRVSGVPGVSGIERVYERVYVLRYELQPTASFRVF
jgi:hypothetical protein